MIAEVDTEMDSSHVSHLAHSAPPMAEAIRAVMFQAYRVEDLLLGAEDFVPLHHTAEQIAATDALFLGISPAGTLAAVAEVESPEPGQRRTYSYRHSFTAARLWHCR